MNTEQYKCQSYYDNNNVLTNCTCGKCQEEQDALNGQAEAEARAKGEWQQQEEADQAYNEQCAYESQGEY